MAETVKKTRTTTAKPKKPAAKKSGNGAAADPSLENHHAVQQRSFSHDEVARLAHSYWQQRGGQHGNHIDDWFRAEQELRGRAS